MNKITLSFGNDRSITIEQEDDIDISPILNEYVTTMRELSEIAVIGSQVASATTTLPARSEGVQGNVGTTRAVPASTLGKGPYEIAYNEKVGRLRLASEDEGKDRETVARERLETLAHNHNDKSINPDEREESESDGESIDLDEVPV